MKTLRLFRLILIMLLLTFLACVVAGLAQNSNSPPAGGPASPVAVEFVWPHDGDTFQSPTNIEINVWITPRTKFNAGDIVKVELFAGTKSLGVRRCSWHDEERPHPKHPRDALPMWIKPAQFDSARWVWKNVPPGKHVLAAKATYLSAPPALSKPVNITVPAVTQNK